MNVESGSVGVGGEDGNELATNLAADEDAACSLAGSIHWLSLSR